MIMSKVRDNEYLSVQKPVEVDHVKYTRLTLETCCFRSQSEILLDSL